MKPDTNQIIAALVAQSAPVRRLAPAWRRALGYLGFAALVLLTLALLRGVRADLAPRLATAAFATALAGGLATGIAGTLAALMLAAPDRSRWWITLPAATASVWLGAVGLGCLTLWVPITPGAVTAAEVSRCLATVILAGTPLSLALVWLLHRATPLRPGLPLAAAALGASGMTAAALSLLHSIDPSAMILAWNAGIVALAALAHWLAHTLASRTLRPA